MLTAGWTRKHAFLGRALESRVWENQMYSLMMVVRHSYLLCSVVDACVEMFKSSSKRGLILLARLFNNVEAKLSFNHLANTSVTHAFDRLFKCFDHFAWTKPPKITTFGFA